MWVLSDQGVQGMLEFCQQYYYYKVTCLTSVGIGLFWFYKLETYLYSCFLEAQRSWQKAQNRQGKNGKENRGRKGDGNVYIDWLINWLSLNLTWNVCKVPVKTFISVPVLT